MMKLLAMLALWVAQLPLAYGQEADTPAGYLSRVQAVATSERSASRLVKGLDSLVTKLIPSRSYANVEFNRAIDFGFTQRRLALSLNFCRYRVNLLCRNDTIYLVAIASEDDKSLGYNWYNEAVVAQFLQRREQLYGTSKSASELQHELADATVYAFYCGDGAPPTEEGLAIQRLVAKRKGAPLLAMLTSFNCERQAYGVAGLTQLQQQGYRVSKAGQALVAHIRYRNAELVTCSGCLSGLVKKVYVQP